MILIPIYLRLPLFSFMSESVPKMSSLAIFVSMTSTSVSDGRILSSWKTILAAKIRI